MRQFSFLKIAIIWVGGQSPKILKKKITKTKHENFDTF